MLRRESFSERSNNLAGDSALRFMSSAERKTTRDDIYSLTLTPDIIDMSNLGFDINKLPEYMGVKGGAARQVLEAAIFQIEAPREPRDIDLVIDNSQTKGYDSADVEDMARQLSLELSPRDTEYGYGVEFVDRVESYMRKQDFTINQALVLHRDGELKIFATTQAVIDTSQHIIRPTIYEHNDRFSLGNKLALKAVRLLSSMQEDGIDDAQIRGVDLKNDTYGDVRDDYFMQILQIDKALENDYATACRYLGNLKKLGITPYGCEETADPIELYQFLLDRVDFKPSDEAMKTIESRSIGERFTKRLGEYAVHRVNYEEITDPIFGVKAKHLFKIPSEFIDEYL